MTTLLANIRAEWVKLRSVRSTMWGFVATIAITVALSAMLCTARVSRFDRMGPAQQLVFEPIGFSLNGVFLSQLAIGVLGVIVMTSEFSTGQVRATFAATPTRGIVVLAKVLVFSAAAFVVGLISSFAAFFVGTSILSSKVSVSITSPHALRCVLGAALYLTGVGLLGLGLGAIIRRTAGAIAVLVGLVLIAPQIIELLPSPWNDDVSKYMPGPAGQTLFHVVSNRVVLSNGAGAVVFLCYPIAACIIGWLLIRSRDA